MLRLFPVLVASLGLLALAGWLVGTPTLASLGASGVPMAPSTAVLFVAFAVAFLLPLQLPSQHQASGAGVAISAAGAVVALLLLVLSLSGIRLEAEHVGVAIAHAANSPAIGHMSPLTAACFLLVALSYLAAFSFRPGRPQATAAAKWLGGLLLALSVFFALAHVIGTLALYESSFIPPAAPTSAAFILLAIWLLGVSASLEGRELEAPAVGDHTSSLFVAVTALAVAGVATGGRLYYQSYAQHFRAVAEAEISSVAALKVGELTNWRAERIADATVIHDNALFASLVRRWFDNPADAQAEGTLRGLLASIREAYAYDRVSLLDAQGVGRLSVPKTSEPIETVVQQQALEIQRSGKVAFVDFFRDGPTGPIHLAVLAPILNDRDRRPIGSVVLRIDPLTYIYPFINRWPVPSRSAETLLIRRDGNDALFLNALRFAADAALTLRFPLTRTEMPAVQAALGQEGIVEGRDYRGVRVVAAVRAVPNSPWNLVSRMDVAEVYAPLQERFWVTVVVLGIIVASATTIAVMIWRRQQRARRLAALEQEVAQARLLRLFFDLPFIGMARMTPDIRQLLQFNDRLCEIVGHSREELAVMAWTEIVHPLDVERDHGEFDRMMRGASDGFTVDKRLIRRDGVTVFASVNYKCVRRADGAADCLVAMVDDITERKAAEAQLRRSHKMESVGLLAGGVAHEFNNMMAVILGNSELALRKADQAQPMHALLTEIETAARRSTDLTRQLLAFARKQAVSREVLDLNESTRGVLATLQPLLGEGIHLAWQPAPQLWAVATDPSQLGQILTSVCANARAAMSGAGTLTISTANCVIDAAFCATRADVVPGEYVRLTVTDTGSGMDAATLDRIFEPFFTTRDVGKGVGVSLAMVYGIVQQNGGFITASSEPGHGAAFEIHLPRHVGD